MNFVLTIMTKWIVTSCTVIINKDLISDFFYSSYYLSDLELSVLEHFTDKVLIFVRERQLRMCWQLRKYIGCIVLLKVFAPSSVQEAQKISEKGALKRVLI